MLLLVSLVLLGASWYVAKFVLEWRINTIRFIMMGGVTIIGGGAALLSYLGIDVIK